MRSESRKQRRGLKSSAIEEGRSIGVALESERMALVVSLASNSPELAQAALEGGADALRLPLNAMDPYTGSGIGSYQSERTALLRTVNAVSDIEKGIHAGSKRTLSTYELDLLADMGLSFFSIDAVNMPVNMFYYEKMRLMLGLRGLASEEALMANHLLVDYVEECPEGVKGVDQYLSVAELLRFTLLTRKLKVPLAVSTTVPFAPNDVKLLARAGVKILILTPRITGRLPETVASVTHEFRYAIGDGFF